MVDVAVVAFTAGESGNALGRPKGSKNKITILKLMAEEAVRSSNSDAMLSVCRLIIEQAEAGDKNSQKLVWDTVMSKGLPESQNAQEKVEINIGTFAPKEKPVAGELLEEDNDEQPE